MRRSLGTARRAPTAATRALALAAVLAASGVVAGTASAAGGRPDGQASGLQLAYTCRSAAGREHAAAQITVHFPATGTAGKPVSPGNAQVALTVPRAALSARPGHHHRATVTGDALLAVGISAGGKSSMTVWPGLAIPATHLPARGTVTLTATGAVPPITPTAPGKVAVTAAGLLMVIRPHEAPRVVRPGPNQPASSPSANTSPPSAPAGVRLACTPAPGQNATLATLLITGKKTPSHRAQQAPTTGKCPKLPPGGLKFNPRFPLPKKIHAPGTQVLHFPSQGCAYTTGYADARKLKGAALLTPALTNVEENIREVVNFNPKVDYADLDNAAQLDFHGLHEFPPSKATFLTFGFVPTTASIALVEHGTINIYAIGPAGVQGSNCKPNAFRPCESIATVNSRLSVRIIPGSVNANGVPLDVGPRCETSQFDAIAIGTSASNPPYSIQFGGPLTGTVNIPSFHNCGVGENLNLIFNAAISGPQNFTLLTQGDLCSQSNANGCDPKTGKPIIPTPLRKVSN